MGEDVALVKEAWAGLSQQPTSAEGAAQHMTDVHIQYKCRGHNPLEGQYMLIGDEGICLSIAVSDPWGNNRSNCCPKANTQQA